jgi:hypothetical protein
LPQVKVVSIHAEFRIFHTQFWTGVQYKMNLVANDFLQVLDSNRTLL